MCNIGKGTCKKGQYVTPQLAKAIAMKLGSGQQNWESLRWEGGSGAGGGEARCYGLLYVKKNSEM